MVDTNAWDEIEAWVRRERGEAAIALVLPNKDRHDIQKTKKYIQARLRLTVDELRNKMKNKTMIAQYLEKIRPELIIPV